MPFFNDFSILPEDPILSLPLAFAADLRKYKVNLGIGAYRTAEGFPLILNSVKKAESLILHKQTNKEYLPIEGDAEFLRYASQLLFGNQSSILTSGHLFTAQTVGASGALRIGGELLSKLSNKTIFLSQPSWPNHKPIFERSGLIVGSYPYFDSKTHLLDFQGMYEGIKNMPIGSALLLHGCCHNPTGVDPTFEQWQELSKIIKQQQLIPFFDIAYQGFGQDLESDAKAIRYFAQEGHEMLVAYSFAKNFGLYNERIGFLALTTQRIEAIPKAGSQIKGLIRGNYSTPPAHGAQIVTTILKSPELRQDWETELKNMKDRVKEMRAALIADLLVKGYNKDFSYMHHQNGLFSFCGLDADQVHRLRQEKGIYMPSNGRINIAGINTNNLEYVAESFVSVL
jgi:aspartate/tyrosine/aromatic aminotransferase